MTSLRAYLSFDVHNPWAQNICATFRFCIKMPFLHRLACFRDDVVFLIFLYQRWIYRIDPNRVNEYGQVLATDVVAASTTPTIEGKGEKTAVPEESRKDR